MYLGTIINPPGTYGTYGMVRSYGLHIFVELALSDARSASVRVRLYDV